MLPSRAKDGDGNVAPRRTKYATTRLAVTVRQSGLIRAYCRKQSTYSVLITRVITRSLVRGIIRLAAPLLPMKTKFTVRLERRDCLAALFSPEREKAAGKYGEKDAPSMPPVKCPKKNSLRPSEHEGDRKKISSVYGPPRAVYNIIKRRDVGGERGNCG